MKEKILSLLLEIVEGAKSIAPEAWAIILKQIYVQAIGYCVWSLIGLIGMVASIWGTIRVIDTYIPEMSIGTIIGGILALAVFAGCAMAAIGRFINPAYYAILFILEGAGLG